MLKNTFTLALFCCLLLGALTMQGCSRETKFLEPVEVKKQGFEFDEMYVLHLHSLEKLEQLPTAILKRHPKLSGETQRFDLFLYRNPADVPEDGEKIPCELETSSYYIPKVGTGFQVSFKLDVSFPVKEEYPFEIFINGKDSIGKSTLWTQEKLEALMQKNNPHSGQEILQKRLVWIATILYSDNKDASEKVYEVLHREGIDPIIEGSKNYHVSVEKNYAEKAVELLRNDEFLKNSKVIVIEPEYMEKYLVEEFLKSEPLDIKPENMKEDSEETLDGSEKILLTVTIDKVGIAPQRKFLFLGWLIEATVNKSENPEIVEDSKISFLIHSPIKFFFTEKVEGEKFEIEFAEPFNVDEIYSGKAKVKLQK